MSQLGEIDPKEKIVELDKSAKCKLRNLSLYAISENYTSKFESWHSKYARKIICLVQKDQEKLPQN